uniref:Uncharacterized protein n=1 Tax=Rhizophora mucronata TaxID=61149 RepID=A0A2P2QI48_RHIMU
MQIGLEFHSQQLSYLQQVFISHCYLMMPLK